MGSLIAAVAALALAGCGADDGVAEAPAGTRLEGAMMWQLSPPSGARVREQARDYCAALNLAGHGDWRLPTISELRALVRGCPGREWGGACKVADPTCLTKSCWTADTCGHCKERGGPAGGCYWEPGGWKGSCTDNWFYWTSSVFDKFVDHYWVVRFQGGGKFDDGVVGFNEELGQGSVRCVREP